MSCQLLHYFNVFALIFNVFALLFNKYILSFNVCAFIFNIYNCSFNAFSFVFDVSNYYLIHSQFVFNVQNYYSIKSHLSSTFYITCIIRFLNLILSFWFYLQCYNLCSKETQWLFNKHANYCLMLVLVMGRREECRRHRRRAQSSNENRFQFLVYRESKITYHIPDKQLKLSQKH